ncbi:uncharacterized protein LOC143259841 [Megalopta genalis]|uniref:uncharacterized protein LOC143259841 n=1 Tax=Megalopta genalis TaxID=115081 RepID=UPI003FD3C609
MASQEISLSTLRRKRGNIIGQITALTKILDNSQDPNNYNESLITEYLDGLRKAWERFDDIQLDIEMLDHSEESRRFEIQGSYYAVTARAKQMIRNNEQIHTRTHCPGSPFTTVSAPMAIKLPEMRLSTFDGTLENWTSFYDLFSSMIDRNEDLTPVQRLQYLRSTLTGKAAACIQSLQTTDVNYLDAIETLKDKFDWPLVPTIATSIPGDQIDRTVLEIPKNLKLADPTFHRPAPIDMLLGAGTALSILSVGQIHLSKPHHPDLYLQKTMLGWVIGGSAPSLQQNQRVSCHANITPNTMLQCDLTRFWELEDGPQTRHYSDAETACEENFKHTITRNVEGRYIVALPFNQHKTKLGESKSIAHKRLMSLERKLRRDPALTIQYEAVLNDYLDQGYMSQVPDNKEGCYLPHHGVIKLSSQTTKLRVVFDGSAATSTGLSLNDALHTGPKLQNDLLYILLRFRTHQYVITGDIEKMYRQFLVRPEDRKYQQILWRDDDGEIKTYQLNTVTFGLSAAPYLAIRCLTQLAEDEGHRFNHASNIIKRDFYVDDLLTGTTTIEEAISLRNDLTSLLNSAGLHMRQWASNDRCLLEGLTEEHINKQIHLGDSSVIKTLGIVWNSTHDSITYTVKPIVHTTRVTKRMISSEIARIYDPLDLLGPVIIVAKLLLQELWTLKIDWDKSLPMTIHAKWLQYYTKLPLLNNVRFQRKVIISSATTALFTSY